MFTSATQLTGMLQNLLPLKKGNPQEKTNEAVGAAEGKKDQVSISLAAQKAQMFLNSEISGVSNDPEMDLYGLESLKQRGEMLAQMLHMKLDKFHGEFLDQLKTAGINADMPVDLKKGADGELLVAGDHPDKARINQILAGNDDLTKKFDEISKLAGLTHVLQSVADQSSNPFASVAALYSRQSQTDPAVDSSKISSERFQLSIAESSASFNWE